jgi:hypothetical protein
MKDAIVLPQPQVHQQTLLKPVGFLGHTLQPIALGRDAPPMLQVIIDAEEEFDWSAPFDRRNIAVENLAHQEKAQRIFERYGVRPTYVVDYAVASQEQGFAPMRAIMARGTADIGAGAQQIGFGDFGVAVARCDLQRLVDLLLAFRGLALGRQQPRHAELGTDRFGSRRTASFISGSACAT